MSVMSSRITCLTIVYSSVYSGADQRKHHSSASLAFVRKIHPWSVNSPDIGTVTQKSFSFDDVIMWTDRPTSSWWLQICWCQVISNNHADSSIIKNLHNRLKQCWRDVGRSTNCQFFYCWWARLFASKVHHPGNVIILAVNGLAPKRHQYTSKHHSETSSIPVYSSSLKPCYTTYIPHYSH